MSENKILYATEYVIVYDGNWTDFESAVKSEASKTKKIPISEKYALTYGVYKKAFFKLEPEDYLKFLERMAVRMEPEHQVPVIELAACKYQQKILCETSGGERQFNVMFAAKIKKACNAIANNVHYFEVFAELYLI